MTGPVAENRLAQTEPGRGAAQLQDCAALWESRSVKTVRVSSRVESRSMTRLTRLCSFMFLSSLLSSFLFVNINFSGSTLCETQSRQNKSAVDVVTPETFKPSFQHLM